jgi:hypothetical protein
MGRHSSQVTSEGQTPNLGSARVSRAGFGVSPKQAFLAVGNTIKIHDGEDAIATRETRGLPEPQNWALDVERWAFRHYVRSAMSIFPLRKSSRPLIMSGSILLALLAATTLRTAEPSPTEQKVLEAIKSQDVSVVHLWAPWCSNCQAELKTGGWLKIVKDNTQ